MRRNSSRMKYLALTTLNKIEKPIIKIRSNNELSLKKRSSKMYRDSKDLSVLSGFSSRIRRSDVTRKVGKVFIQARFASSNFFCQQILFAGENGYKLVILMNGCSFTNLLWRIIANLFVKKENDRYRPEPPVIPNGFEKVKGFAQSVLTGIFTQDHVVRRAGRHEDNGRDVIEALDPFTPLVPLTAHVKHTVRGRFKGVAGDTQKRKEKTTRTHTHSG